LICKIKEELNKEDHQMVTIYEFAEYSGIDTALIAEFID
jgi:hypothetical protein